MKSTNNLLILHKYCLLLARCNLLASNKMTAQHTYLPQCFMNQTCIYLFSITIVTGFFPSILRRPRSLLIRTETVASKYVRPFFAHTTHSFATLYKMVKDQLQVYDFETL